MRLDILMPAAGDAYAATAQTYVAPYLAAFAARGVVARPRAWDLGPSDADATLALVAWGYHFDVERWQRIIADWPAARPLFNAPALIAWNTRKTYLRDLDAAGVPIVPSIFGTADADSVAAAFSTFSCEELVVKPQVSAGSHQTLRVRPGMPVSSLREAIIQPFLPAVLEEGELSFLVIGGALSHAVRKVPALGDFRIQPQFGGRFSRFEPEAEQVALVDHVIAALPEKPLYARVDLIRLADGSLALMELEAIEPDLYVEMEPGVPDRLAEVLIAAL